MSEWLAALVLWFVQLAGLKALPLPGTCEPVPGPVLVIDGEAETRAWCIDEWGTMREQAGSR
jgi:hypothetical protein